LAPLAAEGLLRGASVTADIKAGLSGAGRAPNLSHHFSEANESIDIASISGQNQKPEIEQELSNLADTSIKVTFIPHTVPLNRGILATIYCRLKKKVSLDKAYGIYEKFYAREKFIRLLEKGNYPSTKNVRYSNMCDIGASFQDDVFVSVVALDNLGKGASGQAIQNMNIMFDFPETEGLLSTAIYP
jgi:N-acetyl-gamma-glutamyl-phosphate reductase